MVKIRVEKPVRAGMWMWKLPSVEEELRQIDKIADAICDGKLREYNISTGVKLKTLKNYVEACNFHEALTTYDELSLLERFLIVPSFIEEIAKK